MENETPLAQLRGLLQAAMLKAEMVEEVEVFTRDGLWVVVLPKPTVPESMATGT